ncbi:VOC family protein [Variovorax sp. J22P271]|uniref:VOC family protein n=1 Tax=Variovorax davisae TaxID=3053515 RepID=UPI002578D5F3|nr:VOC family protein [Variovorax sp. J22P271]MDM0032408.1 VOC family protein [Variovorax sp. J22P271]
MTTEYALGYLRFEVSNLEAWRTLLTDVMGLVPGATGGATTGFRMDRYASRVQLVEGALDDICGVGFVSQTQAGFDAALQRLAAEGVITEEGSDAEARERQVQRFVRFVDPDGSPLELAYGQKVADAEFASPLVPGGFEADELGVGHIILPSADLGRTQGFYERVLGARLSDVAKQAVMGVEPTVAFMSLNRRHHSFGFLHGVTLPKRTAHFQVEVNSVEEVGQAFDRARNAGVPILQELGSHPEHAFSFYAATPSGFAWEIGTGTIELDEQWKPRQLDRFSVWGHRWLVAPGS